MRRVFTHLTQGWQRVLPSMTKAFFFENPDFPTLVDGNQQNNNKSFVPTSPGVARDSFFFFLFILFIYFI
jgi:hypothetical protein